MKMQHVIYAMASITTDDLIFRTLNSFHICAVKKELLSIFTVKMPTTNDKDLDKPTNKHHMLITFMTIQQYEDNKLEPGWI